MENWRPLRFDEDDDSDSGDDDSDSDYSPDED